MIDLFIPPSWPLTLHNRTWLVSGKSRCQTLGRLSSATKKMKKIGQLDTQSRTTYSAMQRHEEKWAFPHSINSTLLPLSPALDLRCSDSAPSIPPSIPVPMSLTYPSQTAATADSGGWPTMWPGSQPGVLSPRRSRRRGTRRALRNCLTFQVLLLFLAPCWVRVSFLATFLVLYVSGRRNCNRFQ